MHTEQTIIQAVCVVFKITRKQLLSSCRLTHLFYARVIAAHLLHLHLGISLSKVGRTLHRSHATVIHYYKTFDIWMERTWLYSEPLSYYVQVNDVLRKNG